MSVFEADSYVARVDLIDVGALVRDGVRLVLLDRDNTTIPAGEGPAPAEVRAWVEQVHAAGIATCLVSNNFFSDEVERSAADLSSGVVHHAMKPAPFAITHALATSGVPAEQAVLVGDQVFTDTVAGNLAGVRTILVRPLTRSELWYTHVFRVFERLVLRNVTYVGE